MQWKEEWRKTAVDSWHFVQIITAFHLALTSTASCVIIIIWRSCLLMRLVVSLRNIPFGTDVTTTLGMLFLGVWLEFHWKYAQIGCSFITCEWLTNWQIIPLDRKYRMSWCRKTTRKPGGRQRTNQSVNIKAPIKLYPMHLQDFMITKAVIVILTLWVWNANLETSTNCRMKDQDHLVCMYWQYTFWHYT